METIRICMFVTQDGDRLRSRPMAAIPSRAENAVWFVTSLSSAKSEELSDDRHCCLMFHQTDGGIFLSVSGRARLLRDSELMRRKWDREAALWFPLGPTDPDVVLLQVLPETAEYWMRPGDFDSVARQVHAARAVGREPHPGSNEKIDLR